jgi:hypothetical protein
VQDRAGAGRQLAVSASPWLAERAVCSRRSFMRDARFGGVRGHGPVIATAASSGCAPRRRLAAGACGVR